MWNSSKTKEAGMSYEFDVFLSYSRYEEWPAWIKEHFMPLFQHWLGEELSRGPKIFVDYNMHQGVSWPHELARALSRSKVLVALWTPTYFSSTWCTSELACMYAREEQHRLKTTQYPCVLIIPATLHDGDRFPAKAAAIQMLDLKDCANVRMVKKSMTAAALSKKICLWAPTIAQAIRDAPPFDHSWESLTVDKFVDLFWQEHADQTRVPSLGDL
jgi:hypothetical protein